MEGETGRIKHCDSNAEAWLVVDVPSSDRRSQAGEWIWAGLSVELGPRGTDAEQTQR
jgi:hypothetical protein